MEDNQFYNLGTKGDPSEVYSNGLAYIVIPADIDRAKYIAECFRTSTVSIYSEHNGYSNRVPIDKFSLNFINFPKNKEDFGSAVSFKCDPVHKRAIIDGVYFTSDELCDLQENQFKFKRTLGSNFVEIVGSPQGKYLALNVNADQGGDILINVKSEDNSGKVSINVDGDCSVTSLTNTTLKQFGKLSLITVDADNDEQATVEEHTSTGRNIFSDNENLHTDVYKINDGNENFVLGQLFKKFMKEFIEEVSNATVNTSIGQMPLINKLKIAEYATDEKLDKFLSTVGFIDK